jgi:hypothetical protein
VLPSDEIDSLGPDVEADNVAGAKGLIGAAEEVGVAVEEEEGI